MVFAYKAKANLAAENEKELATPPSVSFDTPSAK
jgi:LemA protein